MSNIQFVPEIPAEIISAIENGNLVIFVGAGVSAIAGLPLWKTFAQNLIRSCRQLKYINEEECDLILSKITEPKKLISIAYEKFKKEQNLECYYSYFSENLKPESSELNQATKDILTFCKRSNALVVTTNADMLLDEYFEPELIYINNSDEALSATKPGLVKIHGSLSDKESLVFTSSEYLKRYANTDFKHFLHSLFSGNRVVLFIGYGLSEFELLEHTIGTPDKEGKNNIKNNIFVLSPYFSYEKSVKESMDLYYESLNIRQIAYSKDKKGYYQLADVLCDWQKQIEKKTSLRPKLIGEIQKALSSESIESKVPVLLQISSSPEIENYLFIQLRKSSNLVKWIDALIGTSLFDPSQKLQPVVKKELSDNRATYSSPIWNGLMLIGFAIDRVDCSAIYDKIVTFMNVTVCDIIDHPEKATNFNAIYCISSIISKMETNILGETLFLLLTLISHSKLNEFDDFFSVLLSGKTKFFEWGSEDISKSLELLFNYLMANINIKVHYIIAESIVERIDIICRYINTSTINNMINMLDEREKENLLSFASVGSVECYSYDIKYQRTSDLILYILKEYYKKHLKVEDQEIIKAKVFRSSRTIFKLMIYAVSHHFNECKKILFEAGYNPFDTWHIYSDLYFMIQRNNPELSSEERRKLFDWIETTGFNGREISNDYKRYLKFRIVSLLSEYDLSYKKYTEKYKDYCLPKEVEIDEINKIISFGHVRWHSNKELAEEFKNKSFKQIVSQVASKKNKDQFEIYSYCDAIKAYLIENESQIYEDTSIYDSLDSDYYNAVIDAIMEIGNDQKLLDTLDLFQLLFDKVEHLDKKTELISRSFDCIERFDLSHFDSKIQEEIYDFVYNSLNSNIDYFYESSDYISDMELTIALMNHWFSKGVGLLFWLTEKDSSSKSILFAQKLLSTSCDKEHDIFLRYIFAKDIDKMIYLDEEWAMTILDQIFVTDDCAMAYFLFNQKVNKHIYIFLYKNKKLNYLIDPDSNNDYLIVRTVVCSSIEMHIKYNFDSRELIYDSLEKQKQHCYEDVFYKLSALLEQNEHYDKCCELLVGICKKILEIEICKNESYDQVLRSLAKCTLTMEKVDSSIWKCILYLSTGFRHFFSDELFDALNKHFSNYKTQIAKILISLVKHADRNLYYAEQYKSLANRMKNDSALNEEYKELYNCLIDKGIYEI